MVGDIEANSAIQCDGARSRVSLPSVVEALEPSHAQVVEFLTTHAEVQTFDAHPPTNGIVCEGTPDGWHVSPEG